MWLALKHWRAYKCIYSIPVWIWLGITFKLLHNQLLPMFKSLHKFKTRFLWVKKFGERVLVCICNTLTEPHQQKEVSFKVFNVHTVIQYLLVGIFKSRYLLSSSSFREMSRSIYSLSRIILHNLCISKHNLNNFSMEVHLTYHDYLFVFSIFNVFLSDN